jgi:isoquinoline 1-oxidoreductase subunit beta
MLQDIRSAKLSRRSFLVTTGGALGVAVAFGSLPDITLAAGPLTPNAWVTIGEDGIVTIVPPAVEMGQGVQTSLPLILAEELDADWSKVRVAATPDNDKVYGNPSFRNQLTTVGSFAVTGYYEKLRLAGAQARAVLLANAAEAWKVPVPELTTEPGIVAHSKSGRKISYGDLAKTAKVPDQLPQITLADLKPTTQFRLIGKDVPRLDTAAKVNGAAKYGIDTQLPDMLYAAILYPSVQYQKPEQIDDSAAKAISGVVKVVALPAGVGVIAETIEAARKAKDALKVTWSAA